MTVSVEPVAEGLWTVASGSYRALFAVGRESVVAFNTLDSPDAARAYRDAALETGAGKPIRMLVVTIDHLDHAGHGAALAPGADVIAHDLTARVIAGRAAGQPPVSRPVRGEGEDLEVDGVSFRLVYPGPTQGTGNLAAWFPEQRVVFMVGPQANARYGLFPDFHVEQYPASLRRMLELDFETWVPGRYAVMRRDEVERALAYFEALQLASQQAFAAGVPIWELDAMHGFVSEALREAFGDLDGFDEHVGVAAIRIVHHYLMGGWGLEDTQEPELLLAR